MNVVRRVRYRDSHGDGYRETAIGDAEQPGPDVDLGDPPRRPVSDTKSHASVAASLSDATVDARGWQYVVFMPSFGLPEEITTYLSPFRRSAYRIIPMHSAVARGSGAL
jgi:hypothetical protein